jgi:hypothetical protein
MLSPALLSTEGDNLSKLLCMDLIAGVVGRGLLIIGKGTNKISCLLRFVPFPFLYQC